MRWSADDWKTVQEERSSAVIPGVDRLELPTHELAPGTRVRFTFQWVDSQRWEGTDFLVEIQPAP